MPKVRVHLVRLSPRIKHHLRWGLLHVALVVFFADIIAAFWPEFNALWQPRAHVAIGLATLGATAFEYLHDEDIHEQIAEAEHVKLEEKANAKA